MIKVNNTNIQLNLLRSFSIFLVILDHVSSWSNFYRVSELKTYYFIQTITKSGVPLFVMISGYFLLEPKKEKISIFLKKRARRIVAAFFVWSYIYLIFQKVVPLQAWQISIPPQQISFNPLAILQNPAYGHLWFMYLLVGLYLSVPILRKFNYNISDMESAYILIILLVSAMLQFAKQLTGIAIINELLLITVFCNYMLYFEGSYLLRVVNSKYNVDKKRNTSAYILLTVLFVIIGWLYISFFTLSYNDKSVFWSGNSPITILITWGIWNSIFYLEIPQGMFKYINRFSDLSFNIYFVHMIVLWACTNITINHKSLFEIGPLWVSILIVAILVYIISAMIAYSIHIGWLSIKHDT